MRDFRQVVRDGHRYAADDGEDVTGDDEGEVGGVGLRQDRGADHGERLPAADFIELLVAVAVDRQLGVRGGWRGREHRALLGFAQGSNDAGGGLLRWQRGGEFLRWRQM